MTYETLRYEVADGILTLTLNRPDQLNAFTVQMADDLEAAFTRASADDNVRAVVVTGEGRAFCAGMDLSVGGNVFGLNEDERPTPEDMETRFDDEAFIRGVRDTGGRVTLSIHACTKPVIAAVNGPAVGIGATMMSRWTSDSRPRRRASGSCSANWASFPKLPRRGSCRASSASRRRSTGCTAPTSSLLKRPGPAGWFARSTRPMTCSRRHMN